MSLMNAFISAVQGGMPICGSCKSWGVTVMVADRQNGVWLIAFGSDRPMKHLFRHSVPGCTFSAGSNDGDCPRNPVFAVGQSRHRALLPHCSQQSWDSMR